jgi:hypothetical protein
VDDDARARSGRALVRPYVLAVPWTWAPVVLGVAVLRLLAPLEWAPEWAGVAWLLSLLLAVVVTGVAFALIALGQASDAADRWWDRRRSRPGATDGHRR